MLRKLALFFLVTFLVSQVRGQCSPACQTGYACDIGTSTCQTASADCSASGLLMEMGCACFSGIQGSDCGQQIVGCEVLPEATATSTTDGVFSLLSSNFDSDGLDMAFSVPGVQNRYIEVVQIGENGVCRFPSFDPIVPWSNFADLWVEPDCSHTLWFESIPLPDLVTHCGLSNTTLPDQSLVYSSRIHYKVVDRLPSVRGREIFRAFENSLALSITLPTVVNATSPSVTVTAPINLVASLVSVVYTHLSDEISVTVILSSQYPYELSNPVHDSAYSNMTYSYNFGQTNCSTDNLVDCLQTLTYTFSDVRATLGCAVQFNDSFTVDIGCRLTGGDEIFCPPLDPPQANFNVNYQFANLCGSVDVGDSLTGVMELTRTLPLAPGFTQDFGYLTDQRIYVTSTFSANSELSYATLTDLYISVNGGPQRRLFGTSYVNPNIDLTVIPPSYNPAGSDVIHQASFLAAYGLSADDLFAQVNGDEIYTFTLFGTYQIFYVTDPGLKKRSITVEMIPLSLSANNLFTAKSGGTYSDGMSPQLIAGIVIASLVSCCVPLLVVLVYMRRRKECNEDHPK